jgi:hypothetical protein
MDVRYNENDFFGAEQLYGSAAPALDRPEELPREEERALPRSGAAARSRARTVLRIPVFAVLGWALVVVLFTSLILSYIELNSIADETYKVNQEIVNLQDERTKLKIQYESTFKLDQIEQYATNIIGMVPADSSQIRYLNDQAEDQAVILSRETGFAAWLRNALTALAEYFS